MAGEGMAGPGLTHHLKAIARLRHGPQRIAVHGRCVEGRLRQPRRGRDAQHPAGGAAQGLRFGLHHPAEGETAGKRLVYRDHAALHVPDLPPSLRKRRMPLISMPFSTALSMS